MIIVVMGVAGVGKTLIGQTLAHELQWSFLDADEYHSPENIQKMASGVPLNDADREAWLTTLRTALASAGNVVLACSALRRDFRHRLVEGFSDVHFVYLRGTRDLIAQRLKTRSGHFFKAELLESQFDALEEPHDALIINAADDPKSIVERIKRAFL